MSVYYILAPELSVVKIGYADNVRQRFSKIQSDSPVRVTIAAIEKGGLELEAERHGEFATYRSKGEWFRYDGDLRSHIDRLPPIPDRVPSLNALVTEATGISQSYASMILGGARTPPRALAIAIYRKTAWRHPTISDLSDEQIDVLESVDPWTPPKERAAA